MDAKWDNPSLKAKHIYTTAVIVWADMNKIIYSIHYKICC